MSVTTFSLTEKQEEQLREWLPTVKKLVCEKQMEELQKLIDNPDEHAHTHPSVWKHKLEQMKSAYDRGVYLPEVGASGGALVYEFTPTTLGLCTRCKYFGHEINLTDYDEWG